VVKITYARDGSATLKMYFFNRKLIDYVYYYDQNKDYIFWPSIASMSYTTRNHTGYPCYILSGGQVG
jgi:hypothetical protein